MHTFKHNNFVKRGLFAKAVLILLLFYSKIVVGQSVDSITTIKYDTNTLSKVIITLKDGTVFKGYVLYIGLEEIKLQTLYIGNVVLLQKNITSIANWNNQIPNNVEEKYELNSYPKEKPNLKRAHTKINYKYTFNNNYQGLKRDEIYYQNIMLLYNGLDYGITDNLSIGGGAFFLGFIGFFNVHVRTQFKINRLISIGASYNHFVMPNSSNNIESSNVREIGLLSGGITLGNSKANMTIGTGFVSFADETNNSSKEFPNNLTFTFAGAVRINKTLYIVTDNSFFETNSNRVITKFNTFGFRVLDSATTFDFGFLSGYNKIDKNGDGRQVFPYITVTHKLK